MYLFLFIQKFSLLGVVHKLKLL